MNAVPRGRHARFRLTASPAPEVTPGQLIAERSRERDEDAQRIDAMRQAAITERLAATQIPFGPLRGRQLADVPRTYLEWLADWATLDFEAKLLMYLGRRVPQKEDVDE